MNKTVLLPNISLHFLIFVAHFLSFKQQFCTKLCFSGTEWWKHLQLWRFPRFSFRPVQLPLQSLLVPADRNTVNLTQRQQTNSWFAAVVRAGGVHLCGHVTDCRVSEHKRILAYLSNSSCSVPRSAKFCDFEKRSKINKNSDEVRKVRRRTSPQARLLWTCCLQPLLLSPGNPEENIRDKKTKHLCSADESKSPVVLLTVSRSSSRMMGSLVLSHKRRDLSWEDDTRWSPFGLMATHQTSRWWPFDPERTERNTFRRSPKTQTAYFQLINHIFINSSRNYVN